MAGRWEVEDPSGSTSISRAVLSSRVSAVSPVGELLYVRILTESWVPIDKVGSWGWMDVFF